MMLDAIFGGRIRIAPGQRVGLDLSPDERQLLLAMSWLDEELEERIRSTSDAEANVMFTLDEMDLLLGDVAAESNHTTDDSLQAKLDAILERIELRLRIFTDEFGLVSDRSGAEELPFDLPEGYVREFQNAVLLSVGVIDNAEYLRRTRRKKVKPGETIGLRLTKKQRQTLLDETEMPKSMADRLQLDSEKPETLEVTMDELRHLRGIVGQGMKRTRGNVKGMLSRVEEKVTSLLAEHVDDPR